MSAGPTAGQPRPAGPLRFVVAGGGIAGLATAIGLARSGHWVRVLERNPQFTELGAGIQLAPNAFAALQWLGVDAGVRASAVQVPALRLLDGTTGRELARLDIDERYRSRFGDTYAVAHRGDLYRALVDACAAYPGIELVADASVVGYSEDGRGVVVRLAGGECLRADGLIGADGIRSAVRAQLLGDGPPRVSGHTIYRSLVEMTRLPDPLRIPDVCLWAGPGWHFVHYPVAHGDLMNLAITRDDGADRPCWGAETDREEVLAAFPDLAGPARALLEHGSGWRSWVLCDRDPTPSWSSGRVLLVGDAAHPMLQYAAQGACMALEDAVSLAMGTDGCGLADVADAFGALVSARGDRVARAQLVARWLGQQIYHADGQVARWRDDTLDAMTSDELLTAVSWLHGGGPDGSGVDQPAADRLAAGVPA